MSRHLTIVAATALAALALGAIACKSSESKPTTDSPPEDEEWLSDDQIAKAGIHVDTAKIAPLPNPIVTGGRVAFDDLRVSHVYSPVTGRVDRVLAKPGQRVAKGAPLLELRSPDLGSVVSDVAKARADVTQAKLDFDRETKLIGEDATSKRALEAAEDAYRKAQAEADRATLRARMLGAGSLDSVTQTYTLRSFIAGEVLARAVAPGAEVVGQYGGGNAQELFTIGDIQSVWVYADVTDLDLPKIHVGDAVDITVVAYPGRHFHGAIDLIAGTVDPALRTARVRAQLANTDEALKPGMLAQVSIAQPAQPILAVPEPAVVAINDAKFVYVEVGKRGDGRTVFKRKPVLAGETRDGEVAIRDGVAAGDHIVVQGTALHAASGTEAKPTAKQVAAAQITTTVVTARDVPDAVSIGGRLAFDDTKLGHVFSPVNGRITTVLVRPGQRVVKGQPLVSILSPDVGNYIADVVKADADRVQAEHELARQHELYASHIGAQRDLEAAEDAARKATAEYNRAKQLTQLLDTSAFDTVSQQYVLRSPIAGQVIVSKASPGLEVQGQYANGGSSSNVLELFTIGDPTQLWVLGEVYEQDLPRIAEGDDVSIHVDAYPDQPFHGKVEWVADVVDPTLHTAQLRCVIDNADGKLRPEMYESVEVNVPGKAVLAVPREAVMRIDGDTIVFVQTAPAGADGTVTFTRTKVDAHIDRNTPEVAVMTGLKAGDIVAVRHSLMLLGML